MYITKEIEELIEGCGKLKREVIAQLCWSISLYMYWYMYITPTDTTKKTTGNGTIQYKLI